MGPGVHYQIEGATSVHLRAWNDLHEEQPIFPQQTAAVSGAPLTFAISGVNCRRNIPLLTILHAL